MNRNRTKVIRDVVESLGVAGDVVERDLIRAEKANRASITAVEDSGPVPVTVDVTPVVDDVSLVQSVVEEHLDEPIVEQKVKKPLFGGKRGKKNAEPAS